MGPQLTVLIIEVSLFHRFIYTHLYCNGTTADCIEVATIAGLTVVTVRPKVQYSGIYLLKAT